MRESFRKKYLEQAINIVKKYFRDDVLSVILFGTLRTKETTKTSDIDLIFVFKDNVPETQLKKLDAILTRLEMKYGLTPVPKSILNKLSWAINRITGMYKSHFICRYQDITNRKFCKIFNLSPIITKIFAPQRMVLNNFIKTAKVIYGKNILLQEQRIDHDYDSYYLDLVKSYMMNLLLWFGATFMNIFDRLFYKYIIEAIKWSIYGFIATRNDNSDGKILRTAIKQISPFIDKEFIYQFLRSKQTMEIDPFLILKSPLYISKIHIEAQKNRKY
ncbi:MAG: nucleotidyltransferase domain-containing protein [Candidatus Korarchaeota archaeon]|nr:nucleotidyltransferase domain-containing protein [Candidatus Korarchaeota archaeon]